MDDLLHALGELQTLLENDSDFAGKTPVEFLHWPTPTGEFWLVIELQKAAGDCVAHGIDAIPILRLLEPPLTVEKIRVAEVMLRRMKAILPTPTSKTQPATTANDARDEWIYEQCCKLVPYAKIRIRLSKHEKWAAIDSDAGVKLAASRYAKRHDLPPIPSRQPGRPTKKTTQD